MARSWKLGPGTATTEVATNAAAVRQSANASVFESITRGRSEASLLLEQCEDENGNEDACQVEPSVSSGIVRFYASNKLTRPSFEEYLLDDHRNRTVEFSRGPYSEDIDYIANFSDISFHVGVEEFFEKGVRRIELRRTNVLLEAVDDETGQKVWIPVAPLYEGNGTLRCYTEVFRDGNEWYLPDFSHLHRGLDFHNQSASYFGVRTVADPNSLLGNYVLDIVLLNECSLEDHIDFDNIPKRAAFRHNYTGEDLHRQQYDLQWTWFPFKVPERVEWLPENGNTTGCLSGPLAANEMANRWEQFPPHSQEVIDFNLFAESTAPDLRLARIAAILSLPASIVTAVVAIVAIVAALRSPIPVRAGAPHVANVIGSQLVEGVALASAVVALLEVNGGVGWSPTFHRSSVAPGLIAPTSQNWRLLVLIDFQIHYRFTGGGEVRRLALAAVVLAAITMIVVMFELAIALFYTGVLPTKVSQETKVEKSDEELLLPF
eukprot:CAMPEP_0198315346 /NCGR_PEP_ID=MMETSP1450-20131203/5656_1 /TAXON_ID=753684 ORGANISM="Madagascaria erythrocladiodes, Strain CCMP3234" /NCGR_SAMPLE_ID=MMETSP1450 /ASSEMBLY_ACC=CAM_ASM_001115 /LENGTH=489 /DNA_ID=CAMNT_0044018457 /DNA_START=77 /DNA_END=1546 /DNA_ORIENTATION=+